MAEETALTKRERTRRTIEQAAYELFLEQGFNATSMRQIAGRAGLALGGIYNHYASKEEIFRAIILERHPYKQILPLVRNARGRTAEEFFRNAARAALDELGQRPDFLKLMFIEVVEFNGQHISLLLREVLPEVLPVFEELASRRESLRRIGPVLLIRSFIAMFFSYYLTDLFIRGSTLARLMPKNSFDTFLDIYLYGVLKETK
ncbi:MAG TPA: TetR/AcrR family transcriptional regulator [Anaerolineales bacterium]|nr:TetR/AcrR family transcriptional regulator [Anaerolineales bacterium]